jgi:imidazoleglycerol-phosphate dehydratase
MADRKARIERATKETKVSVEIDLDGAGDSDIATGVGFFDHMLDHLARHGLIDMTVRAEGDLHIDFHHTVEDVSIVLGQAIAEALGGKEGIRRFGSAQAPMDDAMASVVVDLSGRAAFVYRASFPGGKIGDFDVELIEESLRAIALNSKMNLHVSAPYGTNNHHIAEAIFKALALALREAVSFDPRVSGPPSTKGTL